MVFDLNFTQINMILGFPDVNLQTYIYREIRSHHFWVLVRVNVKWKFLFIKQVVLNTLLWWLGRVHSTAPTHLLQFPCLTYFPLHIGNLINDGFAVYTRHLHQGFMVFKSKFTSPITRLSIPLLSLVLVFLAF